MHVCMFEIIFDSMMMEIYACALRLCMYLCMVRCTITRIVFSQANFPWSLISTFQAIRESYVSNGLADKQHIVPKSPPTKTEQPSITLTITSQNYKASSHGRINTTKPSNPLSHKSFVIKSICKSKSNNSITPSNFFFFFFNQVEQVLGITKVL